MYDMRDEGRGRVCGNGLGEKRVLMGRERVLFSWGHAEAREYDGCIWGTIAES